MLLWCEIALVVLYIENKAGLYYVAEDLMASYTCRKDTTHALRNKFISGLIKSPKHWLKRYTTLRKWHWSSAEIYCRTSLSFHLRGLVILQVMTSAKRSSCSTVFSRSFCHINHFTPTFRECCAIILYKHWTISSVLMLLLASWALSYKYWISCSEVIGCRQEIKCTFPNLHSCNFRMSA